MLEFVTAVMAVYTERKRLQNSCVELRIDNNGAWKWLTNREMTHLWGQGWMRLLQAVCTDYNITIKPVLILGKENVVADALSRYKRHDVTHIHGVDLSVLEGKECMACPGPVWRGEVWAERLEDVYRS